MIPKGATLEYGDWIEMYRGSDGQLVIWYRRDTFGQQWPSQSSMDIYPGPGEAASASAASDPRGLGFPTNCGFSARVEGSSLALAEPVA